MLTTYVGEAAMKVVTLIMGFCGAVTLADGCGAQIFDDPFSQYVERSITIWPGAGNANNANAAIHAIDPWPPYAGYTRIPGDARHAVDSINRMYLYPNPFLPQQPGFGPGPSGGTIGAGVGGPGTQIGIGSPGGATPLQPISGGN
jgi:hypothetical protein